MGINCKRAKTVLTNLSPPVQVQGSMPAMLAEGTGMVCSSAVICGREGAQSSQGSLSTFYVMSYYCARFSKQLGCEFS